MSNKNNKKVDLGTLGAVALKVATDKGTKAIAKTVVAVEKTDFSSVIKWGVSAVVTKTIASSVGGTMGEVIDNVGDALSVVAGISAIKTVNQLSKNYKKITDNDISEFISKYDEDDEDEE